MTKQLGINGPFAENRTSDTVEAKQQSQLVDLDSTAGHKTRSQTTLGRKAVMRARARTRAHTHTRTRTHARTHTHTLQYHIPSTL
jgi:hypothetical protein